MTAWQPKFKAGEWVRSAPTNNIYRVPSGYVEGESQFEAYCLTTDSHSLWTQVVWEDRMVSTGCLNILVDGHTADPTPSATQPNYYRFEVRGVAVDIIDVIQGLSLGCEAGNVYKYLARAGKKDASKHIEDLEKAREWLDRLIEFRRRA